MGGKALVVTQYKNRVYWQGKAGTRNPEDLQTNMILALRKDGYTGTLNDMLFAFYKHEFGIDELTDGLMIFL